MPDATRVPSWAKDGEAVTAWNVWKFIPVPPRPGIKAFRKSRTKREGEPLWAVGYGLTPGVIVEEGRNTSPWIGRVRSFGTPFPEFCLGVEVVIALPRLSVGPPLSGRFRRGIARRPGAVACTTGGGRLGSCARPRSSKPRRVP